ncbi:MAG: hypothetical protein U1E26_04555 [Coriobacteriia bacterium]|nr:hypothetical protein [Coriobacteriia bacterium]
MTIRTRNLIASVALCVVLVVALSGCTLFSEDLATENDTNGLFHLRYPESWQSFVQPGLIALYAADELPDGEDAAFDTLSVGVYTATEAATVPVDDRLTSLLELRAEDREWKDQAFTAPREVTVGKRPAWAVDVTGTDAKDREFAGRAVLVRTNGSEVLLFAVSPAADWEGHSDDVDALLDEWYWHRQERETSATAEPTATP